MCLNVPSTLKIIFWHEEIVCGNPNRNRRSTDSVIQGTTRLRVVRHHSKYLKKISCYAMLHETLFFVPTTHAIDFFMATAIAVKFYIVRKYVYFHDKVDCCSLKICFRIIKIQWREKSMVVNSFSLSNKNTLRILLIRNMETYTLNSDTWTLYFILHYFMHRKYV